MYLLIKGKNPAVKFGFSELCMLGPCGTHSVCVCTHHQNVVLLLNAIKIDKIYHELNKKIVCDRDSKEYMVQRCSQWPGIKLLKALLTNTLRRNESGDSSDSSDSENGNSDEPEITFKQWCTADRAERLPAFLTLLNSFLKSLTRLLLILLFQESKVAT